MDKSPEKKVLAGTVNASGVHLFFERLLKERIRKAKVTCFSKNHANTLMWSHYADQHRGACLEFDGSMKGHDIIDSEKASLVNVNYDRTEIINFNNEHDWGSWQEILDLFTRKSSDWRYEEEVRINVFDGNEYHQFKKPFLTGIIMGCRTSLSDKRAMIDIVKSQDYQIDVRQAVRGRFDLKFDLVSI